MPRRFGKTRSLGKFALVLVGLEGSVFRVGGAQAIAALAYGTGRVKAVSKIVGPGNAYVAAAKRQVRGQVEIDHEAGPSEVVILADEGFVGNMIDPIPMAGEAVPKGRHRVEKLPPAVVKSAVVFDTDPEDTVVLPQLLKDAGYVTRLAVTRASLVALLNGTEQPDVVFLKLGAPDVDVFKVLEKLRSHPRLGTCAVVMMAAKPSREDIAKSILLGASGWIIKPYTAELVAAAIRGVLTMPAAAAPPVG